METLHRHDAQFWIAQLGLEFHPEGGYFKESYRSGLSLQLSVGARAAGTAIYFLVTADRPSRFHRLQTDEIWHYYQGDALEICCISPEGQLEIKVLGADILAGESLQLLVPAGTWFGARVRAGETYTLCGCTMAPGFDFADFELATRQSLLQTFPEHALLIQALT